MYIFILFPLFLLVFSWGILLQERKKSPPPDQLHLYPKKPCNPLRHMLK